MNMERAAVSQGGPEEGSALAKLGERYLDQIIERARQPLMSFEDAEAARAQYAQSDKRVRELSQYEQTFNQLLRRYGVNINVQKIAPNIFRVPVVGNAVLLLDPLPDGYVYIGGAARAVLERALGIKQNAVPRDIDIASDRLVVDSATKKMLENRYVAEDASHGYGIGPIGEQYFDNRDFTRNELLFDGRDIYCTKACLLDSVRHIIRLSTVERGRLVGQEPGKKDKLLAKALRFVAIDWRKEFVDADILEYENIAPFNMALHLDRAYEDGEYAAKQYLTLLREHRQVPQEVDTLDALRAYLEERLQYPFVFRNIPTDETQEERILDEIEAEYERLPLRASMRRHGDTQ